MARCPFYGFVKEEEGLRKLGIGNSQCGLLEDGTFLCQMEIRRGRVKGKDPNWSRCKYNDDYTPNIKRNLQEPVILRDRTITLEQWLGEVLGKDYLNNL